MSDMKAYQARWSPPVVTYLSSANLTLYSVPSPGGGPVLAAILNIMNQYENKQVNYRHEILLLISRAVFN